MKRSEIDELLALVECEPYKLHLACEICERGQEHESFGIDHVWFLQAKLWRKNEYGDDWGWGYGGKYLLSSDIGKGELVKKFFVACRDYSEHEVREPFKYRGRRILGPHLDIDALWEVAEQYEQR